MRLAVLLLVLAACPRAPVPVEPPVVSAAWDDDVLALRVENANPWPMRAMAVDWELAADEEPLARGRAELDVTIAAGTVATVSTELRLSPAAAARVDEARRENRALSVSGTLHAVGRGRGLAGDFWSEAPR